MKPSYEFFASLLKETGCRAADVSKGTGIHPTVFSDWKSGKSSPKQDKIQLIAKYFGIDWADFYPEEGVEPHYYIDDETQAVANALYKDKDLRVLFDAARGSKPQDLQMAADLLRRLKATNPDG